MAAYIDQIWLIFSLLALISGAALLAALLLLRRFSPVVSAPVAIIITAFLFMGVSSLAGVYLRILDIPRTVIGYRLLNTAAWGYAVGAASYYLVRRRTQKRLFLGLSLPITAGLAVFLALFFFGPFSGSGGDGAWLMLAVQLVVVVLTISVGVMVLQESRATASKPWRSLLRGVAAVLFILPAAELFDYIGTQALLRQGYMVRDGFIFAVGYSVANIILIVSLISSISTSSAGATELVVPRAFIDAFGLSRREGEIVEKVLQGKRDKVIAEELYISPRTVDTHLRNIFRKCEVSSRMELLRVVERYG
jgi:DNA-binding CsgD family transcriptional regulator